MRKLIILLLFLVFTVLAIGFIAIPSFAIATNINQLDGSNIDGLADYYAKASADGATVTVINNPLASFLPAFAQISIVQTGEAGYLYILASDAAKSNLDVLAMNGSATIVSPAAIFMWLFTLLLIIFLPKKRSKKSVRRIAEDVVDDEMDNSRSRSSSRSKSSKKKRRSYDEDDYDDED